MPSDTFRTLRNFITAKMRMSHIYQPLMLKMLVQDGGSATIRRIAAEFLAKDESQLEYYEEITKAMPGRVLAAHGLVEREGQGYRLRPAVSEPSKEEKAEIIRLCDAAVEDYLEKRGKAIFAHRRLAKGYVSGSIRYEVLKQAGFRCELCGVPAGEQALEVDHIVPRKLGGTDEPENFQALCWKCNANKGPRDSTDFRAIREALEVRAPGCAFCRLQAHRVTQSNMVAYAIRDAYPVTSLHTLIIPKRHVGSYFELSTSERRGIDYLLQKIRGDITARDSAVEGFNVGINDGEVAGQTVKHTHVHLIPRRRGDVENPRGGVRGVIPDKRDY